MDPVDDRCVGDDQGATARSVITSIDVQASADADADAGAGAELGLAASARRRAAGWVSDDGARAYHALGTVTGSAGSPCFDAALEPVAIHVGTSHDDAGAPDGAGVAVLLAAVLADLRERGLGDLLGAVFS